MSQRWFHWSLIFLLLASLSPANGQSQGKWATRAPMPSSRTEVAAVELAGKIYVIGGFGKSGDLVEEFDPATNGWRSRASLPVPLHHVGAVAAGGKIYVIGGYSGRWDAVNTLYEYDPAADRWRARAPMPTARGALAVGIVGEKIFAVGGVGHDRTNTGANEEYDPASDRWTKHAPMPTARDHFAIGVVDGKLYAVGGRVDGSYARNLAANEEYDPKAAGAPERRCLPAEAVLLPRFWTEGFSCSVAKPPRVLSIRPSRMSLLRMSGSLGRPCQQLGMV